MIKKYRLGYATRWERGEERMFNSAQRRPLYTLYNRIEGIPQSRKRILADAY